MKLLVVKLIAFCGIVIGFGKSVISVDRSAKSACRLVVLIPILLLAFPQVAVAQLDAGQIERRFETTPTPRSQPGPMIPEFDGITAPETAAALRFTLRGVEIEGSTVYGAEQFAPLYADLIGTEVSVADIYALANQVTAKYGTLPRPGGVSIHRN